MTDSPVFDATEHHWLTAAAREWNSVEEHVNDVLHHHKTPAMMPATMKPSTQQEDTMSIAQLEDDVKTDLTDGVDWLLGFAQRVKAAAPGIIATSEAIGGSTVGKLVEIAAGKFLPPGVEEEFLALAGRYFGSFGQLPAAPAAPPAEAPAA